MNQLLILIATICLLLSCHRSEPETAVNNPEAIEKRDSAAVELPNDLKAMLAKKEVPVLCYHRIKPVKTGLSKNMKSYFVSPKQFAEQMKALHDNGYETILPDDLQQYLLFNKSLPAKPVMITFDDTSLEQYTIGWTEMKKYNFKGVYFIMTISINRPNYMNESQLKELADNGNSIEAHTWDHHMVTKYVGADYDTQLVKPKLRIEKITGKPVKYFAYPFGLWNQAAISELKARGYEMAFILSTKRDTTQPLYTVRRMIVPSQWTTAGMLKAMQQTFHLL